jgi:hypothetical protein
MIVISVWNILIIIALGWGNALQKEIIFTLSSI